MSRGQPEIFNTDPRVQYTAKSLTSRLESAGGSVSLDSRGRGLVHVLVERLWRSLKYEGVQLKACGSVSELEAGMLSWLHFSNHERRHQSLGPRPAAEVDHGSMMAKAAKNRPKT